MARKLCFGKYRKWLSSVLLVLAHGAAAQGANDYVYVHKRLVDLSAPPWQCNCYSVSRSSLISTGNANNQVWVVDRFNDWMTAEAVRDALNGSSNACSFCPGTGDVPAQSGIFVFANCGRFPCTIGVADASYQEPGWRVISEEFQSHPEAWRHACRLHNTDQYFAPEIDNRVINCRTLMVSDSEAVTGGKGPDEPRAGACFLGSWTYRTSTGFTDTHTFLEGGRMSPEGSWSFRGNELTVQWPNSWRNVYQLNANCRSMNGITLGPQGQQRATTMERRN